MHVVAPKEASTCRSKGSEGEWIEITYDFVIACHTSGNISQVKVVEDFESRLHQAVSFVVERDKETQEWNAGAAEGAAWLQWRQVSRKKH